MESALSVESQDTLQGNVLVKEVIEVAGMVGEMTGEMTGMVVAVEVVEVLIGMETGMVDAIEMVVAMEATVIAAGTALDRMSADEGIA